MYSPLCLRRAACKWVNDDRGPLHTITSLTESTYPPTAGSHTDNRHPPEQAGMDITKNAADRTTLARWRRGFFAFPVIFGFELPFCLVLTLPFREAGK